MKLLMAMLILLVSETQFKPVESVQKKLDIDGMKEMLKPMSKSCKKKTGVTDELLAGTANGQWPKERSLMCYFKCLAVMLKAMNKQGEITLSDINKQLNTLVVDELVPRIKKMLEDCLAKVTPSADACEYAFDLLVCGYNMEPTVRFLQCTMKKYVTILYRILPFLVILSTTIIVLIQRCQKIMLVS